MNPIRRALLERLSNFVFTKLVSLRVYLPPCADTVGRRGFVDLHIQGLVVNIVDSVVCWCNVVFFFFSATAVCC